MHAQNACFWRSSPKKIIGQSTCLVRVFAFVSQCNELSNCYCYAIVKREICLGHSKELKGLKRRLDLVS